MIARPYEVTDRAECLRVFDSNAPWYFLPEERIPFERFLDRLPGPYFVVVDEDDLIACGGHATGRVSGEADICWTMVRRDQHGHGVGNFLLTTCVCDILAIEDIQTVRLETSQHTFPFFQRWGFVVVERVPNGFGPGLDKIEMRIVLDAGARRDWMEMVTGGLAPPVVEQPIPAIEHYREWSDHRLDPGHYLGGNPQPHLDVARTGPRGRRRAGVFIGVIAAMTTAAAVSEWPSGNTLTRSISLLFAGIWWAGAIRLFRRRRGEK